MTAAEAQVQPAAPVPDAGAAPAQSPETFVLATDQSRFQAKGLPLGTFRLFPTLDLDAAYDDNVYRTDTSRTSDWYFTLSPAFSLNSDWGRHMLKIRAKLDQYFYRQINHESHTDFESSAIGRLDILEGLWVDATASYAMLHEPRSSADMPSNALKPTRYTDLHANTDIHHSLGPFGVSAGATFDQYLYNPTDLVGGTKLDNQDRNRTEYGFYGKADYEFSPGYAAFVRGSYNIRSYELGVDANGFDRNSTGYRIDAGLDIKVTDLIEGNVFGGYLDQRYRTPLRPVNGFDYGAGLSWYPTPLITVNLTAQHLVDETTIANAAANERQIVNLGVNYAFRHDIVLQAGVGYDSDRYPGASRTDRTISANVGAKYLMNEYLFWTARYQYSHRASSLSGLGYGDNTVLVGLGLQL
jgi:hypothetical protein